jgi:hypothetical protein
MFEAIEKLIENNKDMADIGVPQTEQEVLRAESCLRVRFPKSYREYLKRWGWVSFGPNEYCGLGTTVQDVVKMTERVRLARNLPSHLVVICDHDGDEYVCLDTSSFRGSECPIVVWDSHGQAISRLRANDFESFMNDDMREFLP